MRLTLPIVRLQRLRWRRMAAALLLASCPVPAAAAPAWLGGTPPWSIESPAAAGKRFSLGSELAFERQESLRIAAFDQLVEVVDLASGELHTSRLPGDPGLLNRKFDLVFERESAAPSFALALPHADLFGVGEIYPALTVSAGAGDVRLDFDDRTEPRDSTSLRGHGELFESRLDIVTTLCKSCQWYAATSYRLEKLPPLTVDRSPGFQLQQGSSILRDEVRLGRDVHEVASRVGYKSPSGRTASYVGVRHRWSDLDVEDHLVIRDLFAETRLSSRTRLESETTLAVAGVDVALARGFFSRLETAVGDHDSVVQWSVVYVGSSQDREDLRASEIAHAITPVLADILERYRAARAGLATSVVDGMPVYSRADVEELLDRFESEVLIALAAPELAALRDHVKRRFLRARLALDAAAVVGGLPSSHGARLVRTAAIAAGSSTTTVAVAGAQKAMDDISQLLASLYQFAFGDDLKIPLCVRSQPVKAIFALYRQGDRAHEKRINTNRSYDGVYRGDWHYRLSLPGHKQVVDEPLDLVESSRNILDCELVAESYSGEVPPCDRSYGDVVKECNGK